MDLRKGTETMGLRLVKFGFFSFRITIVRTVALLYVLVIIVLSSVATLGTHLQPDLQATTPIYIFVSSKPKLKNQLKLSSAKHLLHVQCIEQASFLFSTMRCKFTRMDCLFASFCTCSSSCTKQPPVKSCFPRTRDSTERNRDALFPCSWRRVQY